MSKNSGNGDKKVEYRAYLNTIEGKREGNHILVKENLRENNVVAVTVDAQSKKPLNPDCGVEIEITLPQDVANGQEKTLLQDSASGREGALPQNPVSKQVIPLRYMANYRYSEFWCRPFFGTDLREIPDETQALILESAQDHFMVLVPVVNDTYKCVFKGNENGGITARLFSWYDKLCDCKGLAFVYAQGSDPFRLMEYCVSEALKLLHNGVRLRTQRRFPECFEYLGWCSWDSMQIRVSEEGMLEKCEEFREKEIPVKWAILDDMWARVDSFHGRSYQSFKEMQDLMQRSALTDFEADPLRFPDGLAHCIEKVNEFGIQVGIWHPTTGYWRGIEEGGEAFRQLKEYLICTEDGIWVPNFKTADSYLYYKTIHDFFADCGADFVKIDNQTMTRRFYKNRAPVGSIARQLHDGMEASAGEHFDHAMINCMGMGSEDIWNRKISPISRCSDDFQPENREWFTSHALQCAYNSLFQGQFYWCDWDMWWTDDGQARKNSLMRAVSGGPVYVSDKIGRSRADILSPLALKDGRILRCDRPGMPAKDCITQDPVTSGKALKLQNTAGEHGILACFHLDGQNRPVTADISAEDIAWPEDRTSCADCTCPAAEYAVYEYFSGKLRLLKNGEHFTITLQDADDYRLYIFAPVQDGFAVIGRTDKFISPRTIEYLSGKTIHLAEDGPYAYVEDGVLYQM